MRAYYEAFRRFHQEGPGVRTSGQPLQPKRPLPMDAQTMTGRPLAPKPLNPGVTGTAARIGGISAATLSPLGASQHGGIEQPRRKRGRPSRKELEERRLRHGGEARSSELGPLQQAIFSPSTAPSGRQLLPMGEVATSPTILQAAPYGTAHTTPQATSRAGSSNNSGSSGKNRGRGRPKKSTWTSGPPPAFTISPGKEGEASSMAATANQQLSGREQGQESETRAKDKVGAGLAPPETSHGTTGAGSSASAGAQAAQAAQAQTAQAEAEESKAQARWKDTILNE
jgi:hypothetical protein